MAPAQRVLVIDFAGRAPEYAPPCHLEGEKWPGRQRPTTQTTLRAFLGVCEEPSSDSANSEGVASESESTSTSDALSDRWLPPPATSSYMTEAVATEAAATAVFVKLDENARKQRVRRRQAARERKKQRCRAGDRP